MLGGAMRLFAAGLLGFLCIATKGESCTTVGYQSGGGMFMGKSYDWSEDQGMLVANKSGMQKQALIFDGSDALEWESRYASVTFSQHGRDFPVGGMNEAGLAVEIMLGDFEGPSGAMPAVNEVQWIQYVLDTYGSVAEFAEGIRAIKVSKLVVDAHYLVCDQGGICASAEYLDGQIVLHTGSSMPAKVFANSTYEESASHLARHQGFGGSQPIPTDHSSLSRFVRMASMSQSLERQPPSDPIAEGHAMLDSVANSGVWRIIYDLEAKAIHFRRAGQSMRTVNVAEMAGNCTEQVQVYDLRSNDSGDITSRFINYTREFNGSIIRQSRMVPWYLRDTATRYPETHTECSLLN
jgi:choloylglycine hydrolase